MYVCMCISCGYNPVQIGTYIHTLQVWGLERERQSMELLNILLSFPLYSIALCKELKLLRIMVSYRVLCLVRVSVDFVAGAVAHR